MTAQLEIIKRLPELATHPTPLLFVHGAWHAAWCWDEHFLTYFAEHGYCSYALSLRGHGMSEGHRHLSWMRLKDYVHDVEQVADQFQTLPVVVGHSLGGLIVQKFAELHDIPAMVLLASIPPQGIFLPTLHLAQQHPLSFFKGSLLFPSYPFLGVPPLMPEAYFSPSLPTRQRRKYIALLQNESFRVFLDALALDLPSPHRINVPALVLGASQDSFMSLKEVEATAQAYNTQSETIENISHNMMLDVVWQHAAERIIGWLEQLGI